MIHTDRLASITIADTRFLRHRNAEYERSTYFAERGMSAAVYFQFVDYENGIEDEISPNYASYGPIGRQSPFIIFSNGKNRVIRFTARFVDEEFPGEALKAVKFVQSLMLPWRLRSAEPYIREYYPPPKVLLHLALAEVSVEGFVTNCRVTFSSPLHYYSQGVLALGPRFVPGNILMSIDVTSDESPDQYLGNSFAEGW